MTQQEQKVEKLRHPIIVISLCGSTVLSYAVFLLFYLDATASSFPLHHFYSNTYTTYERLSSLVSNARLSWHGSNRQALWLRAKICFSFALQSIVHASRPYLPCLPRCHHSAPGHILDLKINRNQRKFVSPSARHRFKAHFDSRCYDESRLKMNRARTGGCEFSLIYDFFGCSSRVHDKVKLK